MKKLLLVGSNSIHTYNFIELISGYFDEILLVTDHKNESYRGKTHLLNFSFRNPLKVVQSIYEIKRLIREYRPQIVHIHEANTSAWITLRAIKHHPAKSIVTAWGSDLLVVPQKGFLYKEMVKQILHGADHLTADARFVADQMKQLSKRPLDITLVNFGIDPVCKTENELWECLYKKETIIYSNRLHKKLYRIDSIIKTFASFLNNSTDKNWKLVVAGTGEEYDALKKLTFRLNISLHTAFTGWISKEENNAWYRKAQIFISVPESDATSVSLLEAMSAGCIPLISDLPANREWIQDGVNGILTKKLGAQDIDSALKLGASDAAKINFQIVQEKATKELSRSIFLSLYDRILSAS